MKKNILIMSVLGVFMFFNPALNLVMAECPPSYTCSLYNSNDLVNPTNYQIQAQPTFQNGIFSWSYSFIGGLTPPKLNQVSILVPSCNDFDPNKTCVGLQYEASGGSGSQVYSPGIGDPSGFGTGDFQAQTIRWDLNSSSPTWLFTVNKLTGIQSTSIKVKAGSTTYYCRDIAGPSCETETTITVNKKMIYNPNRKTWICSDIDPIKGCEINLRECTEDGVTLRPLTQISLESILAGQSGSTNFIREIAVDGAKCPTVDLDTFDPDHTWYRCSGGWCYY